MSLSMVLVPLAIAVTVTSAETIQAIKYRHCNENNEIEDAIETRYNNVELLMKTLTEHGIKANQISENCIVAEFAEGKIVYERATQESAFQMKISGVSDYEGLICDLELIEEEFAQNLQSYSYNKVKKNLEDYENMHIENEEVLEDNSIVITLTVD